MPTYEVEVNGQTFEIDAPDDQAVQLAVRQLQSQTPEAASTPVEGGYSDAPGWTQPLTALGRGAADMFTGGFLDEMGAAADYAGSQILPWRDPKTYEQALAETRADDKALAEQNPVSTVAGQVMGGVAVARQLAKRGLSPTANAPANASLLNRVVRSMGEGAILSGIYGLGSGEGTEDRLKQGAVNAAIGAGVGGAIPVVASGVSSGYRSVMDSLAANDAARRAGTTPEVARLLAETLNADGSLGQQGMANMQRAGREAMLADAGPNARAVLDTAIQRGGPGAVSARQAIDQRVARGGQDLTSALDNALGQPQGVTATRDAIRTGTAGARSAAYDAAHASPIDYADPRGQAIEQMVRSRVPASAIRRANELMRTMGEESQQILANIADDGTVTFERMPDVRQLDYITRALNDVASEADGAGKLGGQTALGRAYEDLSGSIRRNLRELVPEYANALDTAADPIRRSQAVEIGSRLLSPGMRRDEVASAVNGMSAAERDALAQGVRSQIDDVVANVTRTVQDGNVDAREAIKAIKDLSSRANREKLTLAIGEERAAPLFDELDRIATSFNLRSSVAENSKTFARQAVSGRIDELTAPGAVGTLAQGKPLNAVQRVAQALTGQTPERVAGRQNEIYSQIAEYLTRPAGQAVPAFQAMQNFGGQTLANQVRAQEIARLLLSGQRLAYPASGQLGEAARNR